MRDQVKNMMIGIFVIAAFAIIIFIMLFLHPNIGNEGKKLRVRFADIDKISEGTRVTYGGKPVGEVVSIDEIVKKGEDRLEHNGFIYVYELTLAIDSGVNVYLTDEITSRTSGLLGEKSVSIMPIPVKNKEKLILVTDQILYATESGTVESTLKEFKELTDKVDIALNNINDALKKLRDAQFWENISKTAKNASDITDSLNKPKELEEIVSNILDFSKSINEMTKSTNEIIANVQKGEGTIGKLLVKDDMYVQLSSLLSKAETTLNDVNHYGILFHLDKGWQRLRSRRLNLMQTLRTPQEFRNYFNDEIDSISTSLSRVSMVLEKTDEECPTMELWQNPEYVKVYGELIRRVAELDEYIRMYNQQVMESKTKVTELY